MHSFVMMNWEMEYEYRKMKKDGLITSAYLENPTNYPQSVTLKSWIFFLVFLNFRFL